MNDIFASLEQNFIEFEDNIIHVIIDINDKLWINANNLANALGYRDTKDAIKVHIDKNDKLQLKKINCNNIIHGHPQTLYLTEGGMYKLIFTSKMKSAKKFNTWVTNDVFAIYT